VSPPTHGGGGPPYPAVSFDYGRAQEVIRQLDALIPVLNMQKQDRQNQGQALRQSWKGRYAVEFDGELKRMWFGHADLVTRAQSLRNKIADAITAARAEQRWRDDENRAYEASKRQQTPVPN
jgi:uncharacterized protein YukE